MPVQLTAMTFFPQGLSAIPRKTTLTARTRLNICAYLCMFCGPLGGHGPAKAADIAARPLASGSGTERSVCANDESLSPCVSLAGTVQASAMRTQSGASGGYSLPEQTGTISVGTSLYPSISIATNQPRFDPTSNLLVNAVGAKTGLFGAAAKEGLTWANRYVPGVDQSDFVQLYALSTSGRYGAFFGVRSSDNQSMAPQNVIGSISLVVADSVRPHRHWARYAEGYVPRGSTAFRHLINDENSIQNEGASAPSANPYDVNPPKLLNNLRVDCGIGMDRAYHCTNPLSILNNGAKYRTGIIFGDDSIDIVNGVASALALPVDYGFVWFASPGKSTWRVYADAHAADAGRLILADQSASFEFGQSSDRVLSVDRGGIRTPSVIASGAPPTISGTCQVQDPRGGSSAGAFVFAQRCKSGTIVLNFSVVAPTGWSCSASDMTRAEAALREIDFDSRSVTFDVRDGEKGDKVVFLCSGF